MNSMIDFTNRKLVERMFLEMYDEFDINKELSDTDVDQVMDRIMEVGFSISDIIKEHNLNKKDVDSNKVISYLLLQLTYDYIYYKVKGN